MKIMKAHEAPKALMDFVQLQTDYDYALVHHFDKHPDYLNFFKRSLNNNREVILDNSIFELKKAFDSKLYAKRIEELNPTYYIVPDVLENGYQTVLSFSGWVKEYENLPGMRIGTVQGVSYEEIDRCYRFMSEVADYIAISFDMSYYDITGRGVTPAQRRCNGRQHLIEDLISRGLWRWDKPHHLLGCSLASEFSYYNNNNIYNIRSVDTSNPVIAGIFGKKYNGTLGLPDEFHLADHLDGDNNVFESPEFSNDAMELILYNVEQFEKILNA